MIENHDLGAHLFHLRKQVCAQHDRCVSGIRDGANNVENLSLTRRVESQGRLVKKDHRRVVDECPAIPSRCRIPLL